MAKSPMMENPKGFTDSLIRIQRLFLKDSGSTMDLVGMAELSGKKEIIISGTGKMQN